MLSLEAKQPSLRSAPSSSSSSSTGAARRSTSPFRKRRSEEKKATGDDKPSSFSSSASEIGRSDTSAVEAKSTSAAAMDFIKRWLGCERLQCVNRGRAEEQVGRPAEDKSECCVDALQDWQEVRGAGGGAGWGEGGAGAVDLGAEGAARGCEAGDEEAVFGVRHAAAEDP
ncbi:uncharacterized protein MONOS_2814 [Monocercomonoides exilis]|uniref:uncharacterized protein n=1 Tax=Monocercomonoides exilis TaxID=2049356 RepID=UPI00355A8C59|nr:hypothetical protein MONOS_2814 [Monocercomonoides exilis]|eukprot:MONOS_2814.1-p1 / transcript=MONOS_2814.1 / gene=MONOS_2814 / organism=Monocercomonoides_exilis_PA203 / gene_product=unspecified product / transcript_product=unspecified product / location=Mono_scaffold00060:106009-106905(+) / protein_length=170 / sequence_SO=supercontig / SO=protein_coding / is_pseudo=false